MPLNTEIIENVDCDKSLISRNQEGDFLVGLLGKKAFNKKSAVLLDNHLIKTAQLERLLREKRVKVFSKKPVKVYLTKLGTLVACGEVSIRRFERNL